MCVYVCMYVCMYICIYKNTYIGREMYIYIYICNTTIVILIKGFREFDSSTLSVRTTFRLNRFDSTRLDSCFSIRFLSLPASKGGELREPGLSTEVMQSRGDSHNHTDAGERNAVTRQAETAERSTAYTSMQHRGTSRLSDRRVI